MGIIALFSFMAIPYLFFSLVSQTKLPAYTFIAFLAIVVFISLGLERTIYQVINFKSKFNLLILLPILFILSLKINVINNRLNGQYNILADAPNNIEVRRHNTKIYKQLNQLVPANTLLWNCKEFEDVDATFYSDLNVYHWWVTELEFNELKRKGQKMAFIKSFNIQVLPDYISNDTTLMVIDLELR